MNFELSFNLFASGGRVGGENSVHLVRALRFFPVPENSESSGPAQAPLSRRACRHSTHCSLTQSQDTD